jgi:hypothetical protein
MNGIHQLNKQSLMYRFWRFSKWPIIVSAAIALLFYIAKPQGADTKDANSREPRQLDYSKPVVTDEGAIVCPESLLDRILTDPRADPDMNTVLDMFDSFFNREEKARALGCEVFKEGVTVYGAQPMDSSLKDIVTFGLSQGETSGYFTMAAGLKNTEASAERIEKSYESDREQFQKALPTLDASKSNLRWYPIHGDNNEVLITELVTPYGPCASMGGSGTAYGVIAIQIDQKGQDLGSYPSRESAIAAAEDYCHKWYLGEQERPHTAGPERPLWFSPDAEPTSSPAMPASTTPTSPEPNSEAAMEQPVKSALPQSATYDPYGPNTTRYVGMLGPSHIGLTLVVKPGNPTITGHYFYGTDLVDIPVTGVIQDGVVILGGADGGGFTLNFKGDGSQGTKPLDFINSMRLEGSWSKNGKVLQVSLTGGGLEKTPSSGRLYGSITNDSDAVFEGRVQDWYKAVLAGDRVATARYTQFPLALNVKWGTQEIRSAAELSEQWSNIFTPAFLALLRTDMPHDMSVRKGTAYPAGADAFFGDKGAETLNLFETQ